MSSFQFQSHPFILDSILLPNTPTKVSGFMEDESNISNNSNFYSQFYQPQHIHESPVCPMFHESSSVEDQSSKAVHSDNEHSYVTKKQSADDNSTVVDDKLESGEQVTQKKRTRKGTTLNSSQLKGARQGKSKKQKKCNNEGLKSEKKECKANKKDQKKASDEPPKGYIHVRARRGEATDSHSLAERVRREKISEKMKTLQHLVPGCDKVIGKALMLDEIINYVESLQNQIEFLSMKLASLNPMYYDFGLDLETMIIRPERVNNSGTTPQLSMAASQQQCSNQIQINYPVLDVSTALFLQQAQRSNVFTRPQDNGSLLWEVEDQIQKKLNSSQLNDNLCSFH